MNAERLTRLLEPVVSQVGLELDRVDVVPAGRRRLVRVTIDGDGPDGHGPSLDEISEATAEISHCLDDSGAMGESPYTLEVSSRGVSTPLTQPRHYLSISVQTPALPGRLPGAPRKSHFFQGGLPFLSSSMLGATERRSRWRA